MSARLYGIQTLIIIYNLTWFWYIKLYLSCVRKNMINVYISEQGYIIYQCLPPPLSFTYAILSTKCIALVQWRPKMTKYATQILPGCHLLSEGRKVAANFCFYCCQLIICRFSYSVEGRNQWKTCLSNHLDFLIASNT